MKLSQRKRACGPHETDAVIHDAGASRPVMFHAQPRFVELWLKGRQGRIQVPWDKLYWHFLTLHHHNDRAAAAAAKRKSPKR